jgi:hypothetical protein
MPVRRSTFIRPLVIMAALAASSLCALAQQPPTPSRVRGTIEAVDGDVLAVKSRAGEDFKLHMVGDMRLLGITRIALSDVKIGSFVGATTVPGKHARHRRGLAAVRSAPQLDHDQRHGGRERRG